MIIKTIKYNDPFTGKPSEIEAHFHLNKNDILALQAKAQDAGYEDPEKHLQGLAASNNNTKIFAGFKDFILTAYGKRQGSRFVKTQDVRDEFESSEEFSEFIWHLMTHEDELGEFITGLFNGPAMRAPLLNETQGAPVDQKDADNQAMRDRMAETETAKKFTPGSEEAPQNVFAQTPPDAGEVVHEMPPVDQRGPIPTQGAPFAPPTDGRPRKLTDVELKAMTFADVTKGVAEGRWRIE